MYPFFLFGRPTFESMKNAAKQGFVEGYNELVSPKTHTERTLKLEKIHYDTIIVPERTVKHYAGRIDENTVPTYQKIGTSEKKLYRTVYVLYRRFITTQVTGFGQTTVDSSDWIAEKEFSLEEVRKSGFALDRVNKIW